LKIIEQTQSQSQIQNEKYASKKEIKKISEKMTVKSGSNEKLKPIIERNLSEERTRHKPLIINPSVHKKKDTNEIVILTDMRENLNVVLIIDNREVKNQKDRSYF